MMLSPLFLGLQLLDPVSFHYTGERLSIPPGTNVPVEVTLQAELDEGWYLYSILNRVDAGPIPTSFSAPGRYVAIDGDIRESEASIQYDPNFNTRLGLHSERATFTIPLRIDPGPESREEIELHVTYQACDEVSCLPPKTDVVTIPVGQMVSVADGQPARPDRGVGTTARLQMQTGPVDSPALWIFLISFTVITVALFIFRKKSRPE